MDEKPFLEIDLADIKPQQIDELKKFHKAYFDLDNILSSANELKYTGELKNVLIKEFSTPSPEFVKLLTKQVYDGMITPRILDQFTSLVKRSISTHISDIISDRLKTALKTENSEEEKQDPIKEMTNDSKIFTTDEEMESFFITRAILRPHIPFDRITYRDSQTYFAIFVDNNNRKPISRLYLNSPTNKQIAFIGEDKKEIKYKIESINDIYNYSDHLINAAQKYI